MIAADRAAAPAARMDATGAESLRPFVIDT